MAASVTSPDLAPSALKIEKARISATLRIMMSRFMARFCSIAARFEHFPPRDGERVRAEAAQHHDAEAHAKHLRQRRADGGARDAEAEAQHERHGERDVGHVDRHLQQQAEIGAAASQGGAEDHVVREREGCRPDADEEIGRQRLGHRLARAGHGKGERRDGPLQQDQEQARRACDQEGPGKGQVDLVPVAGAGRLCGEAGGRHAERPEAPEHEVEDHGTERHRAEQMRLAEPPDHRRVDEAEERRRHMRQGHRQGESQHAAMGDVEPPGGGGAVHDDP